MAEPRHFVYPSAPLTEWPSIRDTCAQVGIFFDPWQVELNRRMLATDRNGLWAADTSVFSVCRQSGKTYDVGGVHLAESIKIPNLTTVWSAHLFKTARESFDELKSLATLPKMCPHVDPENGITTGTGNEAIRFRNGSRILFAARASDNLRGFTEIDRLVLDEAQILTERTMSDVAPTLNVSPNPRVTLLGTPPRPENPSEVFTSFRTEAIEGTGDGTTLYLEYGADEDADPSLVTPESWDAVAQANPSYPKRVGKRAIRRLKKLLITDENFAREGLGIWDAHGTGIVIDPDLWASLADEDSKTKGRVAFAVDVTPGHSHTSICVAGHRADGLAHVEVVDHRPGTKWAVGRVAELADRHKSATFTLDPSGPAGSLLVDLKEAGVDPELVSGREMAQACGNFFDQAVNEKAVRHIGQPLLASAVNAGRKRTLSDAWAWARRDTDADISPLVGVTLALWQRVKPGKRVKTGSATFF